MLNLRGKFLSGYLILPLLFVITLMIFLFQRKRTISDDIYNICKSAGIDDRTAKYIVCQAAHETATAGIPFTSGLAIANNNYFGIKKPGRGNQIGYKDNGYCIYANMEGSVKDLIAWYYAKGGLINWMPAIENYSRFLKLHNYYEDSEENYTRGLNHWYKHFYL